MLQSAIVTGFDNPVHDSQYCFRQLMTAMSEPGTVHQVRYLSAPDELLPSVYQVALTLFDAQTTVALSTSLNTAEIVQPLVFHCGSPIIAATPRHRSPAGSSDEHEQPTADFIVFSVSEWADIIGCSQITMGEPEYPDRSTTLIMQVPGISTVPLANVMKLRLTGPGIDRERIVFIKGVDAAIVRDWQRNQARFPLGVDLLVCCPESLLALPRTCQVEVL